MFIIGIDREAKAKEKEEKEMVGQEMENDAPFEPDEEAPKSERNCQEKQRSCRKQKEELLCIKIEKDL